MTYNGWGFTQWHLQKLDPEKRVEFCTASGDSSGYIQSVSDEDGPRKRVVILNCIGTHAFGEKLD